MGVSLLTCGTGLTLTSSESVSLNLYYESFPAMSCVPTNEITLAVLKEVTGGAMGLRESPTSSEMSC